MPLRQWLGIAALLLSGCQTGSGSSSTPLEIAFAPVQISASGSDLHGNTFVYATEVSPKAVSYAHAPRAVYLTFPTTPSGTLRLEEASVERLTAGVGTLRIAEHGQVPRLYIIESGTVRVTFHPSDGPLGSYSLVIDAVMIDPLDNGSRIHLRTPLAAPVAFIS